MVVSVIIPVYNQKAALQHCLASFKNQTYSNLEIIVVDDGSKAEITTHLKGINLIILRQSHLGPGIARNLGAQKAKGQILAFADADMTFKEDYLEKLIKPIISKESKGTFTKEEFVSNFNNPFSRSWNLNLGIKDNRRIPDNYPETSPVFRAILKSEFDKVGGFENIGYTDDWTLSRKLGYSAKLAKGAICYHHNPGSAVEVFKQARWIGKNEFISGTILRRIYNLIRLNPFTQFFRSVFLSFKYKFFFQVLFSFIYYSGITQSIILSFFAENKYK